MVEPPRVPKSPDAYPARPVRVPFQSTPLCSVNRLSSIETIASFIVSAILSLGTSKRRWEYSQAMVLPLESTIVETAGMSPSRSCADPLATMSEARLDIRPTPPATGNSSAATITLANRQHQASLMIEELAGGRSNMGYSVLRPSWGLRRPVRRMKITKFSSVAVKKPQFMAGLDACAKKAVTGLLRKRHLTT